MKTGSFKKSTSWMIFLHVYGMILAMIIGPLTARALGPEVLGKLSYAEAIIAIFYTFSVFGLNHVVINELAKNDDKTGEIVGTTLLIRISMTFLAMVLSAVVIRILKPDDIVIRISTYIQTTAILFEIYDVLNYWFQAKLLGKYFSIISAIGLTIEDLWKLYLIIKDPDIFKFSFSNSIRYGFILIALLILFFKMNPSIKLSYNNCLGKEYLKRGLHFLVASLGTIIYYRIDSIMVGNMINASALAFYTIALNISNIWLLIPNTISSSAQPLLAKYKVKDNDLYIKTYQLLLLGQTLFGVIVSLIAMILGKPVIQFLYGDRFINAIPIFYIIIWSSIFSALSFARNNWIINEKYENYSKYFVYIGAFVDIILNHYLIRRFGVIGAAYATLITEIVVFFIAPLLFKKTRQSNRLYFGCFKQFPALITYIKQATQQILNRLRKA